MISNSTRLADCRSVLLLVVTALMLSACGFQLRSSADLPSEMASTNLVIDNEYSDLARRLEVLLTQSGVQLVGADQATAILEVPVNRVVTDVLTIGDNARVREYRVSHTVEFRLLDAGGAELLPRQTLRQTREISFDEQEILGASREQEYLQKDLANLMARLILQRLEGSGN
ncbi:MAG TPA: LPS assembly lipoprotein LptE [Xanthomonadales bacterium]|nr:LPS assembly lipoprotein LptE [Xanthomonadales bacterium]